LAARRPSAGCTRDTAFRRRRTGRPADERPKAYRRGPRTPIPCLRKQDTTLHPYGAFVGTFRVTTIPSGWTRRSRRASNVAYGPRSHHAWRSTAVVAMAMASLREVSALRAAGVRRAGDPLGPERIERQATGVRAVHRVRPQGRDYSASGMGRRAHRLYAVPRRAPFVGLTPRDSTPWQLRQPAGNASSKQAFLTTALSLLRRASKC
jgi:hypothetical protein